jgi:hypothetical protein
MVSSVGKKGENKARRVGKGRNMDLEISCREVHNKVLVSIQYETIYMRDGNTRESTGCDKTTL